jgi:glycosyltransferase involved in cell wall biosynthesis
MKRYAKYSIRASHKIITVSEFSKHEILNYYPEAKNKVIVVHEAIDSEFRRVELSATAVKEFREKYALAGPVVLYVGVLENRKNIGAIIKIADQIAKINEETKFILVGRVGYGGRGFVNEIASRPHMVHLQGIPDATLNILYNISTVFLFPSFYEGFGLPPLEAMNVGLPVLASNCTSIPEVLGDAAILHAPDDADAFTADILRLIGDEDLRNNLRKKGYERVKLFNQEAMVTKFLSVIKSLDHQK